VETVIIRDLIPHIDEAYRTWGTREGRAVEGFSMGGFGALHLGFKYPELFGAVTSLAPAPIRPDSGWPKVERVWQTGPYQGDASYFKDNDPFELAAKNTAAIGAGMRLRLVVGDADNPNTVARVKELDARLRALGTPAQLILVPGVRHSYRNLYDEMGEVEFAFYLEAFGRRSSGGNIPNRGR